MGLGGHCLGLLWLLQVKWGVGWAGPVPAPRFLARFPLALRLKPGPFSLVAQWVLETLIPGGGGGGPHLGGREGFSLRAITSYPLTTGVMAAGGLSVKSLSQLLCMLTHPRKMPTHPLPSERLGAGCSQLSTLLPSPPQPASSPLQTCSWWTNTSPKCSPNSRDTGHALPGVLWPPATGLQRSPSPPA